MKKEKRKFCSKCGKRMIPTLIGAEEYKECYGPECGWSHPYRPYSKETGRRQYILRFTCPNWKKVFFLNDNDHDQYEIDKIIEDMK